MFKLLVKDKTCAIVKAHSLSTHVLVILPSRKLTEREKGMFELMFYIPMESFYSSVTHMHYAF